MSNLSIPPALDQLSALDVLIVEDDPVTRALLDRIVRKRGHMTVPCESAEVALSRLLERFYPIILLDVQLPGIDGFAVAERLAAGSDPPAVVLISSRGADGFRRRLAVRPARGFIAKAELSGECLASLLA